MVVMRSSVPTKAVRLKTKSEPAWVSVMSAEKGKNSKPLLKLEGTHHVLFVRNRIRNITFVFTNCTEQLFRKCLQSG